MTHAEIEQHDLVDRYLLRKLPAEVEVAFTEHYLGCRTCVQKLEAGRKLLEVLENAEPPPKPAANEKGWVRGWWLPQPAWGVAAALAALALYVNLSRPAAPGLVPSSGEQVPRSGAPAPVLELRTYRAADEPGPALGAAEAAGGFWLQMDLRALDAYSSYAVEVVAETGPTAWSGRGAPGEQRDQLRVRVDGSRLEPGPYWVRLSGLTADGSPRLLREYALEVRP